MSKYTWKDKIKAIGPGAVITASFIGPGTVASCTRAGADFGYTLLWTVLFSTIATIVLQEMSAKISIWLVGISIVSGCAAYIAGDLAGTALGLSTLIEVKTNILAPIIGVIVLGLVYKGSFKMLERLLTILVALMAIIFITTMIITKPNLNDIFSGTFIPAVPENGILMVIAIIGTTIVPYNFFIHTASAKNTWKNPDELELSKWDIYFSISTGGLITAAILITSAVTMRGVMVKTAADLAIQLEPLLGKYAKYCLSLGIFAITVDF